MCASLILTAVMQWAHFVSPLEKIRPGLRVPRWSAQQVSLARNECEGFQIYFSPPLQDVDVAWSAQAPVTTQVFREAFVDVVHPSHNDGGRGPWPDALIPLQDPWTRQRRATLPRDSTDASPLILYVEICASSSGRAGIYPLRFDFKAKGKSAFSRAIDIHLQRFAIPVTSSLPNSFGLSKYSVARGHAVDAMSLETDRLLHLYAQALLSHRLSAWGMGMDAPPFQFRQGQGAIDFTEYDKQMAPFLLGTALPNGARFTTTDLRDSPSAKTLEEKTAYYRLFQEHLQTRYGKTLLFFYAKDEPKPKDYPLVLKQARAIHSARSNIPVLVTSTWNAELKDAFDILAPTLNCFFPKDGLPTCEKATSSQTMRSKLQGRKLWWYQSCNAHGCELSETSDEEVAHAYTGWASYMVDHSAMRNRAMGPLAFLAGIDGELYFDTVYAYNTQDVWRSVYAFGGNGDGTLFYPGRPETIGGHSHIPVESLRLKHIRDGLEDYEYLKLAQKLGLESLAKKTVKGWVRSGHDICSSAPLWESHRQTLSKKLNELWPQTE